MQLNHIYLGDCIDVMKNEIEDNIVNLVFADPPYNLSGKGLKWLGNKTGGDWFMVNENWDKMTDNDYQKFTIDWVKECHRVMVANGSIYISCTYHNIAEVINALKVNGFHLNNVITWNKTNAMPSMTRRTFTHSTEFIVWAVKGSNWVFNYEEVKHLNPNRQKDGSLKQMRDVWNMPLVQGKQRIKDEKGKSAHPTQKPEEMLKIIISASSNEGDIVLDTFAGSGTTLYMAKELNRKWIGIEREEKYVDVIKKRVFY